jgi:hypothetical protein
MSEIFADEVYLAETSGGPLAEVSGRGAMPGFPWGGRMPGRLGGSGLLRVRVERGILVWGVMGCVWCEVEGGGWRVESGGRMGLCSGFGLQILQFRVQTCTGGGRGFNGMCADHLLLPASWREIPHLEYGTTRSRCPVPARGADPSLSRCRGKGNSDPRIES